MKILVCGDRNWKDFEAISKVLSRFNPLTTVIIHGGASGADSMAGRVAYNLNMKVEVFEAEWGIYGRSAGPIRNIQMLNQKPDLVIFFHKDLSFSKGTAHTVREAEKRGIPILDGWLRANE